MSSALLIAFLSLTLGLGGTAHAMSRDCSGGHCSDHTPTPVDGHYPAHVATVSTGEVSHDQDGASHERCNPFLCHVLILASQYSETPVDHSTTILGWYVSHLSTLEEPDNPDRPPNF